MLDLITAPPLVMAGTLFIGYVLLRLLTSFMQRVFSKRLSPGLGRFAMWSLLVAGMLPVIALAIVWSGGSVLAVLTVIVDTPGVLAALRVVLLLAIGYPLLRIGVGSLRRSLLRKSTAQVAMLGSKLVFYLGIMALLSVLLHELGFNLTAVIGAAGVLGIAIGFASQTSLANMISGIFLVGEQPFKVGEVIQQGDLIGTVLSIDLLSVKIRTPDNKFVRVPNEQLIKGVITTINRYPIRRLDVRLSVAYKEDVARVRAVLADLADRNPLCLDEPKPLIIFDKFGDSGLEFLFAVWVVKDRFLDLKNSIMDQIKERFDREGIEIPFPHMSLYSGEASKPFPIRIVDGSSGAGPL